MTVYPSLFISHGAPTLAIEDGPARRYLSDLGAQIGSPRALIIVSAHHDSRGQGVFVTTTSQPETIYDFGGFPDALYRLKYPAPGAPALGATIADTLKLKGFVVTEDAGRGFDHGAWVPLMLMYPDADIPIVQISIDMTKSPNWHYQLGDALQDFRRDGVLIIGSGSATHNLREFFQGGYAHDDPAPDWVIAFSDWLTEQIEAEAVHAILNAVRDGPNGQRNHPSLDHIHPLFFALGAGGTGAQGVRLHKSTTYGVLSMDVHGFGATDALSALKDKRYKNVQ